MTNSEDRPNRLQRASRDESMPGIARHGDIVRTGADRPRTEAKAQAFAIEAARTLHDDKCSDVMVLDLRGLSQLTDFLVLASGTSDRQMRSAGDDVSKVGEKQGFAPLHHNLNETRADWRVVDLVDVVVHIFEPNTRSFYDLEMMWGDAPRLTWERPGDKPLRGAPAAADWDA